MTRLEIIQTRLDNYANCVQYVKEATKEREKFEAIPINNSLGYKIYNPHNCNSIISEGAMIGYECYKRGVKPTIFHNVENIVQDSAYNLMRIYPCVWDEPMIEWVESFYQESIKI